MAATQRGARPEQVDVDVGADHHTVHAGLPEDLLPVPWRLGEAHQLGNLGVGSQGSLVFRCAGFVEIRLKVLDVVAQHRRRRLSAERLQPGDRGVPGGHHGIIVCRQVGEFVGLAVEDWQSQLRVGRFKAWTMVR
jgi:hypothetical protein